MRILINRKPIYDQPWGGGNNFVKAFVENGIARGHEIVHSFSEDIDCIFVQDPRPSELGISINEVIQYKINNPKTLVVHRVNECDARKGTKSIDNLLVYTSKFSDLTIFVSEWMKNYFPSHIWGCSESCVIYNGVDKEVFKPNNKLKNNKVNVVTHHWSDNEMKGFDFYRKLDDYVGLADGVTFTYIGRHNSSFKNTNVISPLFGMDLGFELGKYDVYISASRFDPGPNHILESLACGLPTYAHIDGGGCLEMVGNEHIYSNFQELVDIISNQKLLYKNEFEVYNWGECMEQCFGVIEGVIK